MDSVRYIVGDATRPAGDGTKIIVHVCNDVGGWGRGFVTAISKRWTDPERSYREWYRERESNDFALGAVQLVRVEGDVLVANLVGQRGLNKKDGKPPVRYDAIRRGLARVREYAKELPASVHMPRIGCGLAGGRWEEIEPVIQDELITHGIAVTVYDFESK